MSSAPLPDSLTALVWWVVEPRHEHGRADDAMLTVTAPGGHELGHITVGWLREYTDLPRLENEVTAHDDDEDHTP